MKVLRIAGLVAAAAAFATPARAISLDGSSNVVCMTFGGLVSCASVSVSILPAPSYNAGGWWVVTQPPAVTQFRATVTNTGGNLPAAEYLLSGFGFFQTGTDGTSTLALTSPLVNPTNTGWSNAAPADALVPGLPAGNRWLTTDGSGDEGVAEASTGSPDYRLGTGESAVLYFSLTGNIDFPVYFGFRGQAYGADGNGSFRCYEGLGGTAAAIGVEGTPICGEGPPTVVPEPATMALLATGLVGLGGAGLIRRRRKIV